MACSRTEIYHKCPACIISKVKVKIEVKLKIKIKVKIKLPRNCNIGVQNVQDPVYLLEPSCKTDRDCNFCEGLKELDSPNTVESTNVHAPPTAWQLFKSLSLLDRLLAPLVLLAMILGIIIGVYAEDGVRRAFQGSANWEGVSIPILIGLLVMIWPALAKVEWERLPTLFRSRGVWIHLGISFVLNWIVAPFIMLGVAWATLPEASLERERKGVLLVGVARCIAMVLIWNTISQGDTNYCAILVVFNSLLQMVLFAPYAALFLNHFGGSENAESHALQLSYSQAARAVGIYLGIPLAVGMLTRLAVLKFLTPAGVRRFFAYFGPVAVLGLLYTIIVLFANQGKRITDNIGSVFRICVPLVLYFSIVWTSTFFAFWAFSRSRRGSTMGGYDKAVTQAFTAGSNNFELAIAVGIASFGTESTEVLAATLGPLIEVPVLLSLSYVALWLRGRMRWAPLPDLEESKA